jgi:TolB protein
VNLRPPGSIRSLVAATLCLAAVAAACAPAADAVVPGGNGRIAYMGLNDIGIFTIDPDGGQRKHVTQGFDVGPSWSPDGERIAYVNAIQGDVWTMRAGGGDKLRVTRNGSSFEPSWSPNGKRLVFVKGGGGDPEIFTMRADGSARSRVTDNDAADFDPDWSPTGKRIVFARARHGDNPDLFKVDPDGTNTQRITNTAARYEVTPAWSPSGRKIAFASGRSGEDEEIYAMRSDGSKRKRLTENDYVDSDPAWSPTGEKLAFFAKDCIWRMKSRGGKKHRIAGDAAWPDWRAR